MDYSHLNGQAFARLPQLLSLTPNSVIFPSSWCPTMDLFVVATPLSSRHRLALWKMGEMGGKKLWDVEVGLGVAANESIAGVAWSPNGLQIALIHQPPRLSFHSVHTGAEIRSIELPQVEGKESHDYVLNGIWWIEQLPSSQANSEDFPDIFARGGKVPGSAHSILQMLPLLDYQPEESDNIQTSRILGFGSAQAPGGGGTGVTTVSDKLRPRTSNKKHIPKHLESFPTLPKDLLVASISPVSIPPVSVTDESKNKNGKDASVAFTSTVRAMKRSESVARAKERETYQTDVAALSNTLVLVTNDRGDLYPYLEGSYSLGTIALGDQCHLVTSIVKVPSQSVLFLHPRSKLAHAQSFYSNLVPISVRVDLVHTPWLKNVAHVSSTIRALLVYVHRSIEEMRNAWFGTDSLEGGRDVGIKWIKVFEEKEKLYEGSKKTNAMFELTNLLFTGKTSASMRDFLGGSGKLSERGLAQWESTVKDALRLLQKSAERKVSPGCERLVIMLEEVRGWSAWPQRFEPFHFLTAEIDECLTSCHRMIELAEWLSKEAGAELDRFRHFMKWIKSESARITDTTVSELRAPNFDPLEVSEYLEHGLLNSSLDKWFLGPLPKLNPSQVKAMPSLSMGAVLAEMRNVIKDPNSLTLAGQSPVQPSDGQQPAKSDLDRNLVALFDDLSYRCAKVFEIASCATSRQAIIEGEAGPPSNSIGKGVPRNQLHDPVVDTRIRERTIVRSHMGRETYLHYLAICMQPVGVGDASIGLCLLVLEYHDQYFSSTPTRAGFALMDCRAYAPGSAIEDESGAPRALVGLNILDLDFFDDETLLIVARTREDLGPETESRGASKDVFSSREYLLSLTYADAEYTPLEIGNIGLDLAFLSREELLQVVLGLRSNEKPAYQPLPIARSRELTCCPSGNTVSLSVNGRENRRCALVLDEMGQFGEIFDIDAERDDEDEAEGDEGSSGVAPGSGAAEGSMMQE